MKKLYPPEIKGSIPAFSGDFITIPYIKNKTVSDSEVIGFALKIKTIQSNNYIGYVETRIDKGQPLPQPVTFDISSLKSVLNVGQYYKVQMAYIYGEYSGSAVSPASITTGYYSTLGIVKYTTVPSLGIIDLDTTEINNAVQKYVGFYSQQGKDITEKVYQYRFSVYKQDSKTPVYVQDWQLHDSSTDDNGYESTDTVELEYSLESNVIYDIQYSVITTNELEVQSVKYPIVRADIVSPDYDMRPVVTLNYDEGYINIGLKGTSIDEQEQLVSGRYQIIRASEKTDFAVWDVIARFGLYKQKPSTYSFKDFVIEQGVTYTYAIQQYNTSGIVSKPMAAASIKADFEDMFLYDAHGRQLKVRYNARVSSFKTTHLEQKLDTIGGKYPTILRNGRVEYKEFPITGLISYFMDDNQTFYNKVVDEPSWNLDGQNIAAERDFKIEVLDWLNNNEPKLVKTPTEGNYIVQLVNVALSPVDAVGRMLHNFQCNAYEICEYSYKNLCDKGFINIIEPSMYMRLTETVDLTKAAPSINLLLDKAVEVKFIGVTPGAKFKINNSDEIMIGTTGTYEILNQTTTSIEYIETAIDLPLFGRIEYAHIQEAISNFDLIFDIKTQEEPLVQFIGEHDVYSELNDIKTNVELYHFLHFTTRPIVKAYTQGTGRYFEDPDFQQAITIDPYTIYGVYINTEKDHYDYFLDGNSSKQYVTTDYRVKINDMITDIVALDNKEYWLFNTDEIDKLTIPFGVILETSFLKQTKEYTVETSDATVKSAKDSYEAVEKRIREIVETYPDDDENFDDFIKKRDSELILAQKARDNAYKNFITALASSLEKERQKYDL